VQWRFSAHGKILVRDNYPRAVWQWREHVARLAGLASRVAGCDVRYRGAAIWQVRCKGLQIWIAGRFAEPISDGYRDYAIEGEQWWDEFLQVREDAYAVQDGRVVNVFAIPIMRNRVVLGRGSPRRKEKLINRGVVAIVPPPAGKQFGSELEIRSAIERCRNLRSGGQWVGDGCIVYMRRPLPRPAVWWGLVRDGLTEAIGGRLPRLDRSPDISIVGRWRGVRGEIPS
jgi:hypothetical protein